MSIRNALLAVVTLAAAAAFAGNTAERLPTLDDLAEAQERAVAKNLPLALIFTEPDYECPYKQDWNGKVIRELKTITVLVRVSQAQWKEMPDDLLKLVGGQVGYPGCLVVDPARTKVIAKVDYAMDARALSDLTREAKKTIREAQRELKKQAEAEAEAARKAEQAEADAARRERQGGR